jgi:hypothetical protein
MTMELFKLDRRRLADACALLRAPQAPCGTSSAATWVRCSCRCIRQLRSVAGQADPLAGQSAESAGRRSPRRADA